MPSTLCEKRAISREDEERLHAVMARFFAIPELVELTLSFLPLAEILRVQSVCRFFNTLITTSLQLQTLLFFRPASKSASPIVANPLLLRLFDVLFHPGPPRDESLLRFPWRHDARRHDAILHDEASWRRMFVTQPPGSCIVVESRSWERGHLQQRSWDRGYVEMMQTGRLRDHRLADANGGVDAVRMGTVYGAAWEHDRRSLGATHRLYVSWDVGENYTHLLKEDGHLPPGTLYLSLHLTVPRLTLGPIMNFDYYSPQHPGPVILRDTFFEAQFGDLEDIQW